MQRYVAITVVLTVLINISSTSFCEKLQQKYSPPERYVSQHGESKNISVYWDSEPAHAAASLLAAILRHVLGYKYVQLLATTEYLEELKTVAPCNEKGKFKKLIFSLSSSWVNKSDVSNTMNPGLKKLKRMTELMYQRVYVHLAKNYHKKEQCKNITQWSFYNDISTLKDCGFVNCDTRCNQTMNVYQLNPSNETMLETLTLLNRFSIQLKFKTINRTMLSQMINTSKISFLFIDYGIWGIDQYVKELPLPQCLSGDNICQAKSQGTIDMYVTDDCLLKVFAPQVFYTANRFSLTVKSLNRIMEVETRVKSIMEAGCKWALENNLEINKWTKYYPKKTYEIKVFCCNNDPDFNKIKKTAAYLGRKIYIKVSKTVPFKVTGMYANCSKPDEVIYNFKHLNVSSDLIGMIVGDVNNKLEVAKILEGLNAPILFYGSSAFNVATIQTKTTTSLWHPKGGSLHISLALHKFILDMKWNRVAVLSEESETAKHLFEELTDLGGILLRNHYIKDNLTISEAEKVLQKLEMENARIVLVNTNKETADNILSAAEILHMNGDNDYALIVREWEPTNKKYNLTHYSISLGCRHNLDIGKSAGYYQIREQINTLWPMVWPTQVTALADAMLTLAYGFADVINKHPQARDDPRSKQVIQQFEKSLEVVPVLGLIQSLNFKNHSLEETLMFIEKWYGDKHTFLARWRVNATARSVLVERVNDKKYTNHPPHDGSYKCLLSAGDPFLPTCYGPLLISAACLFIIVPCFFIINAFLTRRKLIKNTPKTRTARVQALRNAELEKRSCLLYPTQKTANYSISDFDSGFSEEPISETFLP